MSVKNEFQSVDTMFRILREKTKKTELEKKFKNKIFSTCPSFVFAPYTLISPNLHIILKSKLHIQVDLEEVPQFLK